jgi:hypothetical protein
MRGARLGGVVANLFDVHVQRVKDKVNEQQAILAKMTDMRDRGWTRYLGDVKFYNAAAAKTLPAKAEQALGAVGPIDTRPLEGKDVPALYATAQAIEKATYETYRQIRAVELSRLQNLPLQEASENTSVAVPPHEKLEFHACEPAFMSGISSPTDGKLEVLRQQLTMLRCEVEAMVASGYRMLDYAHGLVPDDVGRTLVQGGGGPGAGAQEEGMRGQGGMGRRAGDQEVGYSGADPGSFSHQWGLGVGPVTHKFRKFSREQGLDLGKTIPVAARKVMADNVEAEWMFVDTWNIIGPFANPNRKGIDQKYPPEVQGGNGVDLDAVYLGKPDSSGKARHLRWLFRQSVDVCVVPHFPEDEAVYYAFTEIHSEQEQSLWCIFGSDDWGRCWVNGEVVFNSGKTPHPWVPDRGVQQVRFHKGANSVLFKFENAWGRTGFSLCINLKEQ